MSDEELAEFMRRDIRGGQLGSFGRRLEELGVEVGVHGYASLELKPVNGVTSFDLHHATVLITANLLDAVSVELAFEWEHLGIEADDFYLPHAFIDIAVREWFVIRGGFFEAHDGLLAARVPRASSLFGPGTAAVLPSSRTRSEFDYARQTGNSDDA
jgi:hypothetical protein